MAEHEEPQRARAGGEPEARPQGAVHGELRAQGAEHGRVAEPQSGQADGRHRTGGAGMGRCCRERGEVRAGERRQRREKKPGRRRGETQGV